MPELISGGLLSASFIRKLAEQKNNLVNLVNPACPAAPADSIIVLVRVKRRLEPFFTFLRSLLFARKGSYAATLYIYGRPALLALLLFPGRTYGNRFPASKYR